MSRSLRLSLTADLSKLRIFELNGLIIAATTHLQSAETPARRKLALVCLVWLEKERERLHGITAPKRR